MLEDWSFGKFLQMTREEVIVRFFFLNVRRLRADKKYLSFDPDQWWQLYKRRDGKFNRDNFPFIALKL